MEFVPALAIAFFIVRNKILPISALFVEYDFRKLINFELLILCRMRIIERPLLKRNVSTDKLNKPANLFMLVMVTTLCTKNDANPATIRFQIKKKVVKLDTTKR